jgi:hypothetical protein
VQSIATILVVLGGLVCLMNWMMLYQSYRTKRFHSAVPLLGAFMLGFGMSLIPITRHFAWVAIPLDYGTLILLFALPQFLYGAWTTCRLNLLKEYSENCGNKAANLRFFRNGIFVIKLQIKRPKGETGITGTNRIGKWHKENSRLKLVANNERAIFESSKSGDLELLRQTEGFTSFENNKDCSLMGMDFVLK